MNEFWQMWWFLGSLQCTLRFCCNLLFWSRRSGNKNSYIIPSEAFLVYRISSCLTSSFLGFIYCWMGELSCKMVSWQTFREETRPPVQGLQDRLSPSKQPVQSATECLNHCFSFHCWQFPQQHFPVLLFLRAIVSCCLLFRARCVVCKAA